MTTRTTSRPWSGSRGVADKSRYVNLRSRRDFSPGPNTMGVTHTQILSPTYLEDRMSQGSKSTYYQALKAAGVEFKRHYREYNTDELRAAYDALVDEGVITPPGAQNQALPASQEPSGVIPQPAPVEAPEPDSAAAAFYGYQAEDTAPEPGPEPSPPSAPARPQVKQADPKEMAGQRLNTQAEDEPIRTDEQGRVWYQEEVRKPAYPKPRGRRVLTYTETGTTTKTVQNGQYQETFEVAGEEPGRVSEVKITLPSYQVGIYKDPRYPFKIYAYNGNQGFDLREVQQFYGGSELVPTWIKRVYVENVLCYDIRSTVQAIQSEYREMQLSGRRR